jgi:multiple sugar transport system ATP-binding protein
MSSITLEDVSKVYPNGHVAVRDLNLAVRHGELLVLVGPSGSGKSTVLRLIAGLEQPTSGRVLVDDDDVTAVAPERRDLAMVFQNYALYPHKNVRQNLAFGLEIRRVAGAEIRDRVERVAATLGIEALLDRKPAQLSGGQRQRVALGRALVREPRAFLLDEPLSNLDPLLRVDTRTELLLLHRRLGATMVHVTHDQEEAMTLGTRVAVMRDGRLEQVGTPLEIFQRPANVFVAAFFGSPAMNIWPCAVTHTATGIRLAGGGLALDLDEVGSVSRDRGAVLLGVRPHDIRLAETGDADAVGRVEIAERLGPTMILHVGIEGATARTIRMVVPADQAPADGTEVAIRLRRDRLHLFDERSGVAVVLTND